MQEITSRSLGQENPLKKGMATHTSILVWRIQRTEETGGLQSMGCIELDMTEWLTHRETCIGCRKMCRLSPSFDFCSLVLTLFAVVC